MAETLKKYRVKTIDGSIRYIEAKNIHDAKSKARIEIGQLPNEVNLKIVKKVLVELQDLIDSINEKHTSVKQAGKDLDWDITHKIIKDISNMLIDESTSLSQLAGSMVKLNNGGNKDAINTKC